MKSYVFGLAAIVTGAVPAFGATAEAPAVVELFTSQGCSSCPPANANLVALASRPDVLALTFDVTYWDYLGWKDIFAKPEFTQRQSDYERPLGEAGPFTPQIVVDGKMDIVGADRADVERLIARSTRKAAPAITLTATQVNIGTGNGRGDVWLVRYDPRLHNVAVHAGENAGATLPHKNVVSAIRNIGSWSGAALSLPLTVAGQGLKTAILLQDGKGGPIVAAAHD